jgi:hypothetical protein
MSACTPRSVDFSIFPGEREHQAADDKVVARQSERPQHEV